jgi:hypothetical protein
MEQSFGSDFGGVRVHTDRNADAMSRAIQAQAFTSGKDIFFRQGEYNSASQRGRHLIAHELAHVVQQGGARARGWTGSTPAGPAAAIQRAIWINSEKNVKDRKKTVNQVKATLKTPNFRISTDNVPNLDQMLDTLSENDTKFESWEALIKELRRQNMLNVQPEDEVQQGGLEDEQDPLTTEFIKLQQQGLRYDKPQKARAAQPDFWESGQIAPYKLNCWQTVLYAALKANIIDHDTFVLADKAVGIGAYSHNVLAEAVADSCGDNKIEWDGTWDGAKEALKAFANVEIPDGYVVVIGRRGDHVGVSTGERQANEDPDVTKVTQVDGHTWIENNARSSKEQKESVSDIRVSTIEDHLSQFAGSKGVYWAKLPSDAREYVKAQARLLKEKNKDNKVSKDQN